MFRRIIGIFTAAALVMSAGLSGAAAAPHGAGHPGAGRAGGVHMGGRPGGGSVHFAGRPGFNGGYRHGYRGGGYGGGVPYGYGYGYPYGYYGYDDDYDAGPAIAAGIIGTIGGIIASQGYRHGCWWSHHRRVCR